jgi:hypothetical protein
MKLKKVNDEALAKLKAYEEEHKRMLQQSVSQ